jgi:KDO2-lipid IV(A) lauroyltransferase
MSPKAQRAPTVFTRVRWGVEAGLFDAAFAVITRLPRRAVVRLARWGSAAAWRLARRDRRIALANLRLAYGDALGERERERIVRGTFERFLLTVLDYGWFSRHGRERMERHVTFDAALLQWVDSREPWVAVTAHFGNWEILGRYTAMRGASLASVVKPIRNPLIDARINRARRLQGQVVVPRQGAVRTLLRSLRNGGVVALLLDQDTRVEDGGVFVPFFGVPVPVSSAAALLALRQGIPLVPVFCHGKPDGRYHCHARPALMPADVAGATVEELTARITAIIETEIRAAPDQWLWTYKRWKRRQPGTDPARYPFYADC